MRGSDQRQDTIFRYVGRRLAQSPACARSKPERNKIEVLLSQLELRVGLRRAHLRLFWNIAEQFYLAATAQSLKRLVLFLAQQEPARVERAN